MCRKRMFLATVSIGIAVLLAGVSNAIAHGAGHGGGGGYSGGSHGGVSAGGHSFSSGGYVGHGVTGHNSFSGHGSGHFTTGKHWGVLPWQFALEWSRNGWCGKSPTECVAPHAVVEQLGRAKLVSRISWLLPPRTLLARLAGVRHGISPVGTIGMAGPTAMAMAITITGHRIITAALR